MKQTRRSKYSAIKPIALEHIANGASASAVGRDLGIPSPTVRRWARQAGIEDSAPIALPEGLDAA